MSGTGHVDEAISRQVRTFASVLEEREIVSGDEVDKSLDDLMQASHRQGARLVARAWVDDDFKALLLEDCVAALKEIGAYDPERFTSQRLAERQVQVLENTDDVHNVIVCTLCSCYPIDLLGPSPHWYKSDAYRSKVVRDPRATLVEFGVELPEGVEIRVWDSTSEWRYMVLPQRPPGTEGLDEEALAALVTRAGLIGTALA